VDLKARKQQVSEKRRRKEGSIIFQLQGYQAKRGDTEGICHRTRSHHKRIQNFGCNARKKESTREIIDGALVNTVMNLRVP
jgi:hypothetical protein